MMAKDVEITTEITEDGWKTITTETFVIKNILHRPLMKVDTWLNKNKKEGYLKDYKCCQRCRKSFEDLVGESVYLVSTNHFNQVICQNCFNEITTSSLKEKEQKSHGGLQ